MNWFKNKDSEVERLAKLLDENSERVTIKKNGYLRLNLSNSEVKKQIEETAKLVGKIKVPG
ncbi:hypothetical protein ACFFU8_18270 [Chromobacterium piscinae]|uniref:hypothetical protein n=1 Tax=Chromobacterium piscinae TaxID=686831 RepID=UPI001E5BD22C|nr:hypothetical protein [Chromobacterium piscinae]MCD5326738.1 hypothetical protein [Chromobacterium piscinae]